MFTGRLFFTMDAWTRELEAAKTVADDAFLALQERKAQLTTSSDAAVARLTAQTRRKLTALKQLIDKLDASLPGDVSDAEARRRSDIVRRLRTHCALLADMLKQPRETGEPLRPAVPRSLETLETAERDEYGLLLLQGEMLREQDAQLDELAGAVTRTRHVAVAVNEELDLQARLLDDIEEDVENTHGKMVVATRKLKDLIRRSADCKLFAGLLAVISALVLVLVVVLKFT